MDDDTWIYSETLNTSTYIKEEDLATLLEASAVENVDSDAVNLTVDDKALNIIAQEPIDLMIVDLTGQILFAGKISQSTSIPLDYSAASVVIVCYTINNNTVTKKFKLR